MKDSSNSGGSSKAIKVTPDELVFDQVMLNLTQVQSLTMKNTLSAPVEIVSGLLVKRVKMLKTSNPERVDIEPKNKKLAPFETFTADVIVKITK